MSVAQAGVPADVVTSIATPDTVETRRLGLLEFDDGALTAATAAPLYEQLDLVHSVETIIRARASARWRRSARASRRSGSRTARCCGHPPE